MPQYNTSQLNTFLTLFDALTSTRTYTDKVSHLRSHALWFARYVPTCRSNQTPQTFRYKTQSCDLTINYDILNTDIKCVPSRQFLTQYHWQTPKPSYCGRKAVLPLLTIAYCKSRWPKRNEILASHLTIPTGPTGHNLRLASLFYAWRGRVLCHGLPTCGQVGIITTTDYVVWWQQFYLIKANSITSLNKGVQITLSVVLSVIYGYGRRSDGKCTHRS